MIEWLKKKQLNLDNLVAEKDSLLIGLVAQYKQTAEIIWTLSYRDHLTNHNINLKRQLRAYDYANRELAKYVNNVMSENE
jgi:hypothetical protein